MILFPRAFADKRVKAHGQGRRGFNQNVDGQEAYFGRPFGTRVLLASNPALKRPPVRRRTGWAIFARPFGTETLANTAG